MLMNFDGMIDTSNPMIEFDRRNILYIHTNLGTCLDHTVGLKSSFFFLVTTIAMSYLYRGQNTDPDLYRTRASTKSHCLV